MPGCVSWDDIAWFEGGCEDVQDKQSEVPREHGELNDGPRDHA